MPIIGSPLTPVRAYIGLALIIALLGAGAVIAFQYWIIGGLHEDVAKVTAEREQAMSANLNQAAALDQCLESNAQWMSLGKGVAALKADLAALDKAKTERDAANRLLAERRQNATPECKAILATDLTGPCGPLVDSLRERAQDH